MTYKERLNWIYAAVLLVVPGWYFVRLFGRLAESPAADLAYRSGLLWNVGFVVVTVIVVMILSAIGSTLGSAMYTALRSELAEVEKVRAANAAAGLPNERIKLSDEAKAEVKAKAEADLEARRAELEKRISQEDVRDKQIDRHGDYVAGSVLTTLVLLPLGLAIFGTHQFWIAHALYGALVVAALIGAVVKITAYRRGFSF